MRQSILWRNSNYANVLYVYQIYIAHFVLDSENDLNSFSGMTISYDKQNYSTH
jgi:hypothetical protein